ncbi:MAG: hypothetical protein LC713_02665, partial [Actinobacteria bacterium]|nr:hypothetical protein [Actinomycetota bacterium]
MVAQANENVRKRPFLFCLHHYLNSLCRSPAGVIREARRAVIGSALALESLTPPTLGRLPRGVAAAVGATLLAGLAARASGERLGTPLAPFMASLEPQATGLAPLVALAFALGVAFAPGLLARPARPRAFAVAALGLTLVLRLALAAARGGTAQWEEVFASSREAAHEYLPALPALRVGLHEF